MASPINTNNLWQIFHAGGIVSWLQTNLNLWNLNGMLAHVLANPAYADVQTRYAISFLQPYAISISPTGLYINFQIQSNILGYVSNLHISFHTDPLQGDSPSHIKVDQIATHLKLNFSIQGGTISINDDIADRNNVGAEVDNFGKGERADYNILFNIVRDFLNILFRQIYSDGQMLAANPIPGVNPILVTNIRQAFARQQSFPGVGKIDFDVIGATINPNTYDYNHPVSVAEKQRRVLQTTQEAYDSAYQILQGIQQITKDSRIEKCNTSRGVISRFILKIIHKPSNKYPPDVLERITRLKNKFNDLRKINVDYNSELDKLVKEIDRLYAEVINPVNASTAFYNYQQFENFVETNRGQLTHLSKSLYTTFIDLVQYTISIMNLVCNTYEQKTTIIYELLMQIKRNLKALFASTSSKEIVKEIFKLQEPIMALRQRLPEIRVRLQQVEPMRNPALISNICDFLEPICVEVTALSDNLDMCTEFITLASSPELGLAVPAMPAAGPAPAPAAAPTAMPAAAPAAAQAAMTAADSPPPSPPPGASAMAVAADSPPPSPPPGASAMAVAADSPPPSPPLDASALAAALGSVEVVRHPPGIPRKRSKSEDNLKPRKEQKTKEEEENKRVEEKYLKYKQKYLQLKKLLQQQNLI